MRSKAIRRAINISRILAKIRMICILTFIQLVRKTSSLQGLDISTNLLFFDVFFNNIEGCSPT